MIDYGGGLIFPDSWAFGPPDPPEGPDCTACGDTGTIDLGYATRRLSLVPCPDCSPMENE